MKKCEKCGADNTDTLTFCTNCGAPLLSSPTPAPVAPAPTPAPGAPVATPETPEAPVSDPLGTITDASAPTPAPTSAPAPTAPTPEPEVLTTTPVNPEPTSIPTPTPVKPAEKPAPAKKDNKLVLIILIALVAIIGIVVAVILIMSGNSGNTTNTTTNSSSSSSASTIVEEEASSVVTSSTSTGTNVIVGDYQITVPKVYDFSVKDSSLYLGDSSGGWMIAIDYRSDITYSDIASSLKALSEALETTSGTTVVTSGTETINKESVPYIDYNNGKAVISMAFFKAPNGSTFIVEATNGSTVADHGLITAIAPVFTTAKDASATSTVKIGSGTITDMGLSVFDDVDLSGSSE